MQSDVDDAIKVQTLEIISNMLDQWIEQGCVGFFLDDEDGDRKLIIRPDFLKEGMN